jgi:hypothetical protein
MISATVAIDSSDAVRWFRADEITPFPNTFVTRSATSFVPAQSIPTVGPGRPTDEIFDKWHANCELIIS